MGKNGGAAKGSKGAGANNGKGKAKGNKNSSGTPSPANGGDQDSLSQVPIVEQHGEGDLEQQELLEGEDFFFEDALREVLRDALDPATIEVVTYPTMPAREFVSAVDAPFRDRYGNLAERLSDRIEDYEHRCNYAQMEHARWKAERYRLKNETASLQRQAEAERQAALNAAGKKNVVAVLRARKNDQSDRMRKFLSSRDPADFFDVDFQRLSISDPSAASQSLSRARSCMNWIGKIGDQAFPLFRDVKVISSRFGLAVGSFFDMHRSLLKLSVAVLLCYLYLLIQQFVEHWSTLVDYPAGYTWSPFRLPSRFTIGGFHDGAVAEKWTTAFSHRSGSIEPLQGASDNMSENEFNLWFSRCPVVRHLRDCRVASVFAGRIDRESLESGSNFGPYMYNNKTYEYSPYELFRNNFQPIPGTKNKDYVIVDDIGHVLNPSRISKTWTSSCDIKISGRPIVGYPGYCSESRSYWTGPFVLNTTIQASEEQVVSKEDILKIASGATLDTIPFSGRNLWLALRFVVAQVGSSLVILFFVIRRWYQAELVYRVESGTSEISSIRWSQWVLACWDFRYEAEEDQELWREEFANELRAQMEEEKNEEGEQNQNRWKAWCILAKRMLGSLIHFILLAVSWGAIVAAYIFQPDVTSSLQQPSLLGDIGTTIGRLLPNLTIAFVGLGLPPVTKAITRFEERTRDASARWNLYRLFFAKIFNALLYAFLVGELTSNQPLFHSRFLSERDCRVNSGYECGQDQAGVRLLGLLVSECLFSLFLKPLLRLFRAALAFALWSTFCRRNSRQDHPVSPPPPPVSAPDDKDDDGGDSERGHYPEAEGGGRAFFKWPEFQIADCAVDTVYVQLLMWLTVGYIPAAALAVPVIWFLHFKWLKISLKHLSSRPFVTETAALRVNLQRVLLLVSVFYAMLVIILEFVRVPFEPQCGPYDNHQCSAQMVLTLLPTDTFNSIIGTLQWLASSWLLVLVVAFICIFQNLLQLSVLQSANENVLEQMYLNGEEHQSYLRLQMFRLREKTDLYKKRINWLGEVEKTKGV
eukprot:TRINITY_DN1937_c0_g2_i2.p1 TRINITY_DN1937_c0_g2~~TRINITY_DN1937_c0_g2_i2.p1  ORF type:complete len:1039 (+),score=139.81 TRINITY_DN1937_c0_g2_i2:85-3201(+)